VSKYREPNPLAILGLSKIFIEGENMSSLILSFRNEVPLAIEDADIALAKELNIPFEILLSKIILIFSLSIFCGFNFCIVFLAANVQI
jgi:hypothetical protein